MERGVVRPMLSGAGDRLAVSDPAAGQVVRVAAGTLESATRLELGGMPQSLLLLAAEGEHDH